MVGLPFSTSFREIRIFFKDRGYIETSTVFGMEQQQYSMRNNGQAVILFQDAESASKAVQALNKGYI